MAAWHALTHVCVVWSQPSSPWHCSTRLLLQSSTWCRSDEQTGSHGPASMPLPVVAAVVDADGGADAVVVVPELEVDPPVPVAVEVAPPWPPPVPLDPETVLVADPAPAPTGPGPLPPPPPLPLLNATPESEPPQAAAIMPAVETIAA